MALYRFLFAPVLLAVAVLTTSPPHRLQAAHHVAPPQVVVEAPAVMGPAHVTPVSRVLPSHPGSVP